MVLAFFSNWYFLKNKGYCFILSNRELAVALLSLLVSHLKETLSPTQGPPGWASGDQDVHLRTSPAFSHPVGSGGLAVCSLWGGTECNRTSFTWICFDLTQE